jgi:hypothetical protein
MMKTAKQSMRIVGFVIALTSNSSYAQQSPQNVKIFGATVPARGYAFVPAGTDLACRAIDDGRCFDGRAWHRLFPEGPRKYAIPATNEVECIVIADGDCWTGKEWYRLPRGKIFGRTMQLRGGSFITAPLQP